ncbi:MAG: serine/threonine protein kinase [Chaenotheca gracillima]|nr:MAG: serine/threonine protein kinase [Chaenotheca gracillima]
MRQLWQLLGALAALTTVAQATFCVVDQQRAADAPSGSDISTALLNVVEASHNNLCYGGFPKLPNGSKSKVIHRSNGSLVLEARRHDQKGTLGKACIDAFSDIIHMCISGGSTWAGNSSANHVDFSIYNKAYPKNWTPQPSGANAAVPKPTPHVSQRPTTSSKSTTASTTPHVAKTPKVTPPAVSTQTLPGVTGKPGSLSQTKTTGSNGLATILPIFFGAAGAGFILIGGGALNAFAGAGAGAAEAAPLIPAGYPAVTIGPDGRASVDSSNDEHSPTHQASKSPKPSTSSTSSTTTSSSSAAPTESTRSFVIMPKNPHDSANTAFTNELKESFGSRLLTIENDISGVVAWATVMTETQARLYRSRSVVISVDVDEEIPIEIEAEKAIPGVAGRDVSDDVAESDDYFGEFETQESDFQGRDLLDENEGSDDLQKRASYVHQHNPVWELRELSIPPNVDFFVSDYVYDSSAGEGSTIYVVDSGANTSNEDFANMPGNKDWFYVPAGPEEEQADHLKNDPVGHGSCVISKAAGAKYGVAKKADIGIIKLNKGVDGQFAFYASSGFAALNAILVDIPKKGRKKNVVVISWGVPYAQIESHQRKVYQGLMAELVQLGVVVVIAAGNRAETTPNVDEFPATLASALPLIVVGAVNEDGHTSIESQGGPLVSIMGSGVDITCASGSGNGRKLASGTSFSTPMVGGLAAYLMSHPKYQTELFGNGDLPGLPLRVKSLIQKLAYKRSSGGQPSIFNGEKWITDDDCDDGPALIRERDIDAGMTGYSSQSPTPPTNFTSPFDFCDECEDKCIPFASPCTAACLIPSSGNLAGQCGACISAVNAPTECVECLPGCRLAEWSGDIDCTDEDVFKPCKATDVDGNEGVPGLCTRNTFGRNQTSSGKREPTLLTLPTQYVDRS